MGDGATATTATGDAWDRLAALLEGTLARPIDQRDAYLSAQCPDASDCAEIEALVAAAKPQTGAFDRVVAALSPGPADIPVGPMRSRVGPYELLREIGCGGMGGLPRAPGGRPLSAAGRAEARAHPGPRAVTAGPLHRRARHPRGPRPSEHRAALRRRRDRRRPAVLHHGVRRRPDHRCLLRRRGARPARAPSPVPVDLRRRRRGAPSSRRAPRPEADQRAGDGRWHRQAARLRDCAAARRGWDPRQTRRRRRRRAS